jgi:hypothetical protein
MARPIKTNLEYFPMDTELDKKLKLLKAKYKLAGIGFIDMLWRTIYHEGYFIKVDDDYITILSDEWGITSEVFMDMLLYCIDLKLFDRNLYDNQNVLTSKGIQDRYFHATLRRKREGCEFLLTETPITASITPDISTISTQSKVKESKVKESIKNDKNVYIAFMDWYLSRFRELFGDEYICKYGKDVPLIKKLFTFSNEEEIKRRAELYLVDKDPFIAKNGYSIGLFSSKFNSYSNKIEGLKNGTQKSASKRGGISDFSGDKPGITVS